MFVRHGSGPPNEIRTLIQPAESRPKTGVVLSTLESLIGFDARYQFPVSNVDFMPLIIFVALLILRNRADSLLARAERLVRGEEKKTLQLYRSRSGNHSGLGLNNQPPKGHRQGGDDRHVLRNKALAIFSD